MNKRPPTRPTYEVRDGAVWIKCKKAKLQPSGWLHYELHDGTVGLTKPKSFREIAPPKE